MDRLDNYTNEQKKFLLLHSYFLAFELYIDLVFLFIIQDGKTALYWAVEKGHDDIVQLLLDNDADLENCTKVKKSDSNFCKNFYFTFMCSIDCKLIGTIK